MRSKSMFIGLLVVGLGLLMTIEPATVQAQLPGFGGIGPIANAPTSGVCGVNPNLQLTSDLKVNSKSCAIRQSSEMVKTYAWSKYLDSPSGWDNLWHKAKVCSGGGCTDEERYTTTGLPCPVRFVESFDPVQVDGTHWYQTDEFDATEYEMQTSSVFGE